MRTKADRLVDDYLERLDGELAGLPRARRRELREEIAGHIAEARAALPAESEADVRTLLDRLGEPADIAAEARGRPVLRGRSRLFDVVALVLLLVGGFLLLVGWFVGVVMLWASDTWTTRQKLLGTLVVPGGLVLPLGLLTMASSGEACVVSSTGTTCVEGGADAAQILATVGVSLLLLAPIVVTVYLARRRRYQPSEASA